MLTMICICCITFVFFSVVASCTETGSSFAVTQDVLDIVKCHRLSLTGVHFWGYCQFFVRL